MWPNTSTASLVRTLTRPSSKPCRRPMVKTTKTCTRVQVFLFSGFRLKPFMAQVYPHVPMFAKFVVASATMEDCLSSLPLFGTWLETRGNAFSFACAAQCAARNARMSQAS